MISASCTIYDNSLEMKLVLHGLSFLLVASFVTSFKLDQFLRIIIILSRFLELTKFFYFRLLMTVRPSWHNAPFTPWSPFWIRRKQERADLMSILTTKQLTNFVAVENRPTSWWLWPLRRDQGAQLLCCCWKRRLTILCIWDLLVDTQLRLTWQKPPGNCAGSWVIVLGGLTNVLCV